MRAASRRSPSVEPRPELSVIVPSVNGADILMECLDALAQIDDVRLEVLVIDRCGEAVRRAVRARFPRVRTVPADPAASIPQLRAIGFRCASADNVAVIEDHVLVPRSWARQLLAALAEGAEVVGGSVANAATHRLVDRAAFLCEYSHLLAPYSSRGVRTVAGNNVVYRRALLERYTSVTSAGRWEDHLHAAMLRDGVKLRCRPEIGVGHKRHYRVSEYVRQRYLYARSYAGLRRSEMTWARRVVFAAGTVALPAMLLARTTRRVLTTGSHVSELVAALPLIALFVCAWAAGEAVGYAAGPGDALSHVN